MNKSYFQFLEESRINDTRKTQVATTYGTYKKTGEVLKGLLPPKARTINVGAGLDQTKQGLMDGLGKGFIVHDMEPNPENRENPPEYTSSDQIPVGKYHAAVCHNVLNVVEPEVRDTIVRSIFSSLKSGGHAIIGTRKWTGDIATNKNFELGDEPKSMWVKKKDAYSYQKGFDGNELKDYIQRIADEDGHTVAIHRLGEITANGIRVHLVRKAK
jgi:hypothetical protein